MNDKGLDFKHKEVIDINNGKIVTTGIKRGNGWK